jgi:hypothetical protein
MCAGAPSHDVLCFSETWAPPEHEAGSDKLPDDAQTTVLIPSAVSYLPYDFSISQSRSGTLQG